jgi:hypothetical protein
VRCHPGIIAPDLMQQHIARDDLLPRPVQKFQYRGFLLGESDLASLFVNP